MEEESVVVCPKCGAINGAGAKYCMMCANPINNTEKKEFWERYSEKKQKKHSEYPFVVKIVIGILSILFYGSAYRLSGNVYTLFLFIGGVFSLSACAWRNKWSCYVPAILMFIPSFVTGRHILVQTICIVFAILEFAGGRKIKKEQC